MNSVKGMEEQDVLDALMREWTNEVLCKGYKGLQNSGAHWRGPDTRVRSGEGVESDILLT